MITKTKEHTGFRVATFILIVGLVMLAGFLSGRLGGASEGYLGLTRPPLTPPDAVFSVVWTVLYFMLGWSLYLNIFTDGNRTLKISFFILFGLQMALNLFFSAVFFRLDAYFAAFIMLAVMVATTVGAIIIDFFINRKAAWLIIPYALWIIFATYLTIMINVYN